jgi:hypothetical protein
MLKSTRHGSAQELILPFPSSLSAWKPPNFFLAQNSTSKQHVDNFTVVCYTLPDIEISSSSVKNFRKEDVEQYGKTAAAAAAAAVGGKRISYCCGQRKPSN